MMREDELSNAIVLVLANKQDLPNAMSVAEVTERMELASLARNYKVFGVSGTDGRNLHEALGWLGDEINRFGQSSSSAPRDASIKFAGASSSDQFKMLLPSKAMTYLHVRSPQPSRRRALQFESNFGNYVCLFFFVLCSFFVLFCCSFVLCSLFVRSRCRKWPSRATNSWRSARSRRDRLSKSGIISRVSLSVDHLLLCVLLCVVVIVVRSFIVRH